MKLFKDTDKIILSVKLPNSTNDQYPKATVYDNDGLVVNTYNLSVVGTIGYYNTVLAAGTLPVGSYDVVYEVFRNAARTNKSSKFTDSEEFIRVENYQTTIQSQIDQIIDEVDELDGMVAN